MQTMLRQRLNTEQFVTPRRRKSQAGNPAYRLNRVASISFTEGDARKNMIHTLRRFVTSEMLCAWRRCTVCRRSYSTEGRSKQASKQAGRQALRTPSRCAMKVFVFAQMPNGYAAFDLKRSKLDMPTSCSDPKG
eukprot:TRINITY_DN25252_c0_g1_i1.p1 TRINITY_DN25252_c0_g1~~TRINITY_DN25252_c0_g1_i1.p1  ORF type:complete len:134 (-),score=20.48 TRINITY_DN25252_c0_g1_i1:128-529(-)